MVDASLIVGIMLLIFAGVIFYLYRRKIIKLSSSLSPPAKLKPKPWYAPSSPDPKLQARIQRMKRRRHHKMIEHHWTEILVDLGIETEVKLSKDIKKLQEIINLHQHSRLWKGLTKEEKNAFQKLKTIVKEKIEGKPGTPGKKQTQRTLQKKEKEDIIALLRKIVAK